MKCTLGILCILLVFGCAKHDPKKEIHYRYLDGTHSPFDSTIGDQLKALNTADPLKDAEKAYRQKDHRLVAVLGIGLSIPGVQVESSPNLRSPAQRVGMKIVSGTSDMLADDRHEIMNKRAHEYATAYNAQMIILLTTNGKPETNQTLAITPGGRGSP